MPMPMPNGRQFMAFTKLIESTLQLILLEAFRESVVERTMENRTKNLGFKVSAKIEALPMVPIHQANTDVTGRTPQLITQQISH